MGGSERVVLAEMLADATLRTSAGRVVAFDRLTDLFLRDEELFTAHERQLLFDILSSLLREVEVIVRRDLVERLADSPDVPHDLIVDLANLDIEIAQPLLLRSNLLADPDLIDIVRRRSQDHRLAVAVRKALSAEVADALIETGDGDAIEQLLRNPDAKISAQAFRYLVVESRTNDRFQHPLLSRNDLPPALAHRMFWWVSTTLRSFIMERFSGDDDRVDTIINDAVDAARPAASSSSLDAEADRLVERLDMLNELTQRFLVQALRSKRLTVFIAGMARLARIDSRAMRRIIFDRAGEPLAIACRAVNFDRQTFATLFLLTHHGNEGISPDRFERALEFYDTITFARARATLGYWREDVEFAAEFDSSGTSRS
jgi:uncharacterized protein (DUF2336 family)